jgi:F420-dependent oxidoreductase-like protein
MSSPATPRLRFGVQFQAQRTTWPDYVAAVRGAEELGFDTVWNFDHMLPFAGADDGAAFETWTTLAGMAAATSRIRLGVLVNGVLYRDPATLAKSAVQVDLISNGRLEFSLGAAWAEREFTTYGLPFPPVQERMARLDEALTIVKALWTQPRTTFTGRYYTLRNAPCEPKPVQRPHPPIVVGGNGRTTLRIAAKHADEWNGQGTPEVVAGRVAVLKEECAAIGRDFSGIKLSHHPPLAIGRTHEEAEAKAREGARANQRNLDDERGNWLLGTPAEIAEKLRRYRDAGITHWIMGVGAPFDLAGLRLFMEEVAPVLR